MPRWPRPDTATRRSASALLARHLPRGAAPLLDAGAGTGLIGEWLGIMGYPDVEALDISEGMLAVARAKGVYRALHVGVLGGALPFPKGTSPASSRRASSPRAMSGSRGCPNFCA